MSLSSKISPVQLSISYFVLPSFGYASFLLPQTSSVPVSFTRAHNMTSPPPTMSSPFLTLPTEIRLMIYESFFRSAKIRTIAPWNTSYKGISITDPVSDNASALLGLLLTSRQVRAEALPYLYKCLVVDLDPVLAHMNIVSSWTMVKPRMAVDDLRGFRDVVRRVDLGVVTYGFGYRCADVVDLDLGCLGGLREVRFRLLLGDAGREGLLRGDGEEEVFDGGAKSFASVLQEKWCEDEKRCLGLGERVKGVEVRESIGEGRRVHRNRFVSSWCSSLESTCVDGANH